MAVPGVQRSVLPVRAEAHQKPAGGPVTYTILPGHGSAHAARHNAPARHRRQRKPGWSWDEPEEARRGPP